MFRSKVFFTGVAIKSGQLMSKAIYLVSGGIDSPVAAYLGIVKGWMPVFLYFDNKPFAGEDTRERAIKTINKVMEVTGTKGRTIVVPHGDDLEIVMNACKRNLTCLLCKRLMYRKAQKIAVQNGCEAIVTGEILGEQASQTMSNLILNSSIIGMPIIRPLIGMNKREVEDIGKSIGTYEISITKAQGCGAAAIKARTKAKLLELDGAEQKIHVEEMVERAIKGAIEVKTA
jgi:thiamine biosynthesis protein ThiI